MRKEITLAASLLSLLLTHAAPATAQTAVETAPDESFILFQDEGGATVCREATKVERASLRGAAGTSVIYHGAPLRRARGPAGERLVANAPADSTGLQLRASAGLTIVLKGTEQLEANPTAKNAFIAAANRWEALISTPVTVVLEVDYGPTFFGTPYPNSRILGSTGAATGNTSPSTLRKRLLASNPTASEARLYDMLPASVPAEFGAQTVQVSTIRMTTALARAVGFLTGEGPDAQIGFNSNFGDGGQFDFDPADGITAGQIDFDSVATHEIGHALGFISASGGSNSTVLTVWDIFRFRPATATVANFDSAPRVLTKGGLQVMFGDFTGTFAAQELSLSTGGPSPPAGDTDDGRQSSHWKDDALQAGRPYIGNMDPTISRGLRRTITENDIRAADLLGYSVVFDPDRPGNDNFASSLPLVGGAGTVNGTSLWATREPGELSTQGGLQAGFLGDKSVWYSWTAPLTGTATFTTAGSGFDTTLGVYRGDSVGTVTIACPACENDDVADGANTSQVQFDATAGTVYRIAVDGWNGEYGAVKLNWSVVTTTTPTPGTLQFSTSAYSVGENGVSAAITVNRTAGSDGAVSVSYATSNGNATAGPDYTAASGTLSFAAGETSKSFNVSVNNDSLDEPGETVSLSLSAPGGGATLGPQSTATLTILDDDAAPSLSVGDVTVTEGDAGTVNAVFNVTLSQPSGQIVTVNFATADGTAASPGDYTAASGPLSFAPGETAKTVTVAVKGDLSSEPDETFFVNLTGPSNATLADSQGTGTITDDDPEGGRISFASAAFTTTEGSGAATVTVERTGDTTQAATVDYATSDLSASQRSDYTLALGTLSFAPGEASKSFVVLVNQDSYAEGTESVSLTLSNPGGGAVVGPISTATLDIADDVPETTGNPIDESEAFVRQHYHDFLNREPDAEGLAFWVGGIESCGADQQCRAVKRRDTSAAFFLSIEFQETGFLVQRMYKAAYGDATGTAVVNNTPVQIAVPVVRLDEFLRDTQRIARDVVVGTPGWPERLNNNKAAFAQEFVSRTRFTNAFGPGVAPAEFVDRLITNAGITMDDGERQALITHLTANNNAAGHAFVLRQVAEDEGLVSLEKNKAFVLMQYFGYMRRDPDGGQDTDHSGYNFWLQKLNENGVDWRAAQMVEAFLESIEYRRRFAP